MTNVLRWDKPKAKLSKKDWEESYGFEDGPKGGYVPNMSEADAQSWKAKLTGTKLGFPQVEIRKSVNGAQLLVIVNLGEGYNYKHYRARSEDKKYAHPYTEADFARDYPTLVGRYNSNYTELDYLRFGAPTYGFNVHMSLNGPAQMTFNEMAELAQAVQEAKLYLEGL